MNNISQIWIDLMNIRNTKHWKRAWTGITQIMITLIWILCVQAKTFIQKLKIYLKKNSHLLYTPLLTYLMINFLGHCSLYIIISFPLYYLSYPNIFVISSHFQEFKQVLNGKCLKTEDKIKLVGEHVKASLSTL